MESYDIVEWGKPLQKVLRETPVPVGSEVRVKISGCGVCHSDIHIQDGYLDLGEGKRVTFESIGAKLPFTMGHEIVGVVDAAGPEADAVLGSRCVVYPWIGCGVCRQCRAGHELDCSSSAGLGTRRAGGYSDYVIVPHTRYLLDYGSLDPLVAATCACSGLTGWSALKKLPALTVDDTVVLLGAGGLGLAALGLARAATPARIVVADIDDERLSLALSKGADAVVNTRSSDAVAQLHAVSGEAPRAVIDFVGAASTVEFSLQAVGKGGTVLVVGLFGGRLPLATALLPMRNITLRGSYVGSLAEMRELLALLQQQPLLNVPLFQVPMAELNERLDEMRAGKLIGRAIATP
jgi:D-arabinose 1-dehydrogenase-like Zn-dependent alcohol dehydrogenase